MHNTRTVLVTAALVLGLATSAAQAQLPVPRLNSIFPCGARQGTSVACVVAGGELQGATGLYFSHAGISAQLVKPNTFKVTVAAGVPVGQYDVRVVTPLGLSNFRAFVVSDWPEVVEKEPNNEPATAQRVALPVVINGRMDGATDLDHYVFSAKKGQRILINCWAWRIDSQLDATLMLFDARGKELAYSGDYYGRDPFIDFTAPEDGDYILKVWDFVYGGGGDYFYRLQVGSLPHLDAVVPAAVNPGRKTTVTLYGRNLPGGQPAPGGAQIQGRPLEVITRDIEVPADALHATSLHGGEAVRPAQTALDGMAFRLTTAGGSSNPIFLGFTADPILLEKEPNNDMKSAQRVPVPCDVTGMFAPVGDRDFYAFTAKKGEKIVVETFGERQSGVVDPILVGYDAAGKKLITVDDSGRNIGQLRFTTTHRDARWDLTAPRDGEYVVQVRDSYFQQRGEARFTYRLSVRRPQPDFRLVVVPAAETQPDCTVARRGGNQWMDVLVFRNDGMDEPIRIEADQLPPGVTCDPVVIGPGKTSVPLVFHAATDAPLPARPGLARRKSCASPAAAA
jgi:Bacterial pre-peptidase C-terminal domain